MSSLVGYDVKHSASLLFKTVKPDLSEAHVFSQLIAEAISQQVLVVGMVIREDLSIRIRSFTFVVYRILIFHVKATNESPST